MYALQKEILKNFQFIDHIFLKNHPQHIVSYIQKYDVFTFHLNNNITVVALTHTLVTVSL